MNATPSRFELYGCLHAPAVSTLSRRYLSLTRSRISKGELFTSREEMYACASTVCRTAYVQLENHVRPTFSRRAACSRNFMLLVCRCCPTDDGLSLPCVPIRLVTFFPRGNDLRSRVRRHVQSVAIAPAMRVLTAHVTCQSMPRYSRYRLPFVVRQRALSAPQSVDELWSSSCSLTSGSDPIKRSPSSRSTAPAAPLGAVPRQHCRQ